jgi:N-acyl-D-amino-acid deacylase
MLALGLHATSTQKEFDLIIANGRIVDGTGNPWFVADLAIKDGRIAGLGKFEAARAARTLDAKGLVVAPGFIDVHTHIEGGINERPQAENFLRMGVTSVVTGNCGTSARDLGAWFKGLEAQGVSLNIASLVGHNTIRRAGMNGDFDRAPTAEELQKMRDLVHEGMRAGAVGFSTGLEYIPGTYGKTDEIAELAKVAAGYGGLYATHMRDEGMQIEQSIAESLKIGELANCPVEISHFKLDSKKRWGLSTMTTKLIADARAKGQQVTVDQYAYPAGATNIGIVFPSWVFEGGADKTKERLADKVTREKIKREMLATLASEGFTDLSFLYIASYQTDPSFNGKNVAELALQTGKGKTSAAQAEQACEILANERAGVVLRKMSDADVERIFKQPFTMVASDAGVTDINSKSVPHPRAFGNNARALGVFVRAKKFVSLEEAIRKMTSLPANTFSLWERGLLRPGMAADVVVFDEATISDHATFAAPKQYATGFAYVLVNGQVVIERDAHTGAKPGRMLRGRGAQ